MAMAPLNLVESGVFVEVNVSSNLGQIFDEKRTRPKGFWVDILIIVTSGSVMEHASATSAQVFVI